MRRHRRQLERAAAVVARQARRGGAAKVGGKQLDAGRGGTEERPREVPGLPADGKQVQPIIPGVVDRSADITIDKKLSRKIDLIAE